MSRPSISSQQLTLTDAVEKPEPAADETALGTSWTVGDAGQTATHCHNCGSHVTADFARVYGDNDGNVYACPRCVRAIAELRDGAAADPDHERRVKK